MKVLSIYHFAILLQNYFDVTPLRNSHGNGKNATCEKTPMKCLIIKFNNNNYKYLTKGHLNPN